MVYDLFFIQAFCTLPHFHSLDVIESGPMCFLKVEGGQWSLKEVPPTQHLCGPTSLLWHLPLLLFLLCLQPQLLHMPLRSLTNGFSINLWGPEIDANRMSPWLGHWYLKADEMELSPHCHRPTEMYVSYYRACQWTPSINRNVIFLTWRFFVKFFIFLNFNIYIFWPCWAFIGEHGLLWVRSHMPHGIWSGSSLTRNWTRVLCIGRRVLNHWTTREVLRYLFFYKCSNN